MIAEKLYDNVYYYKNVLDNTKRLVDLIEQTETDKFSKLSFK